MGEISGLLERLYGRRGFFLNGAHWLMTPEPDADCMHAANTIETLQRELAETRHRADQAIEQLTDSLGKEVLALREALKCFLDDERFQVAVGGNPIAVDRMIVQAHAAYAGTPLNAEQRESGVTRSCGCVFCDLDVPREYRGSDGWWHPGGHGYAPSNRCTAPLNTDKREGA